jgi:monofunctional biosynthetic peptidoglycan transglycosylase
MENAPTSPKKHRWLRRIALTMLAFLVIAGTIPLALTALYARPGSEPVSTLMITSRLTGQSIDRKWVSFDEIAPAVWQSVISSEDGQFCAHRGVDWSALRNQIDNAIEGESARGASTIPMQTVKNLFLWNGRSYVRKVLEIPLAVLIDRAWGKRRLMEIYLNIAEWGPGIFGIEAAAQHYFGRSASSLTRRQAARLAVVLPNPHRRNPTKLTKALGRVAAQIERRANRSGGYVRCLSVNK